jgi:hypothetical protein
MTADVVARAPSIPSSRPSRMGQGTGLGLSMIYGFVRLRLGLGLGLGAHGVGRETACEPHLGAIAPEAQT